jgi:hypothetical protein
VGELSSLALRRRGRGHTLLAAEDASEGSTGRRGVLHGPVNGPTAIEEPPEGALANVLADLALDDADALLEVADDLASRLAGIELGTNLAGCSGREVPSNTAARSGLDSPTATGGGNLLTRGGGLRDWLLCG